MLFATYLCNVRSEGEGVGERAEMSVSYLLDPQDPWAAPSGYSQGDPPVVTNPSQLLASAHKVTRKSGPSHPKAHRLSLSACAEERAVLLLSHV